MALKLGEYKVPELHIPVAVAAHAAGRLAAAILRSSVKVYLRAGSAGSVYTCLPEVVLLAHSVYPVHRKSDYLMPDLFSLVVVLINGHIKPVLGYFKHLGDILPSPAYSLLLEIIAEGEVAKHLKECAVTGGFSDILDIVCPYALLTGGHSRSRGNLLLGEIRL